MHNKGYDDALDASLTVNDKILYQETMKVRGRCVDGV